MNLDEVRTALLGRKAELKSRLERTHKHIYHKDEPVSPNFNEQIKQTENDDLVMALEADGIEEIARIDKALRRVGNGEYLQCARCGEDIGEARLRAVPYTDRCIACAQ